MIKFVKGDLFQSGCEAFCNAVNCQGIMGAGLAYAFKKKYPEMNKDYVGYCKRKQLRPGLMHVWENPNGNPKYIINFPTKDDLSPSKLSYVFDGLKDLKRVILEKNITSIAIPALGSGLGGLDYKDVKPLIEQFAEDLPEVEILAHEPL